MVSSADIIVSRKDPEYELCAEVASRLTNLGYVVTSGGGPGLMEAANFGAYMSGYSDSDFTDALSRLKEHPTQNGDVDPDYFAKALEVIDKYPSKAVSLSLPTWYYSSEQNDPIRLHLPNTLRTVCEKQDSPLSVTAG